MVNLNCNNDVRTAARIFGNSKILYKARRCDNLLLLWAYCCHKAVVKLMLPMYVWIAVMVVDLLANEYLLKALVRLNHAELYINA